MERLNLSHKVSLKLGMPFTSLFPLYSIHRQENQQNLTSLIYLTFQLVSRSIWSAKSKGRQEFVFISFNSPCDWEKLIWINDNLYAKTLVL